MMKPDDTTPESTETSNGSKSPATPDQAALARLIMDYAHRTMMHHAMWFMEVAHQLGPVKAYAALGEALERSTTVQMNRLAKILGFEMHDDLPGPLLALAPKTLEELKQGLAVNWLANDGIWFQTVEFTQGMFAAKRCNDSCWSQFSPFEAWSIRRLLGLPEQPGLEGLKKALGLRLYASINEQSIVDEGPGQFSFYMNACRVQTARKRKGLDDYPCKSGGMAEYPSFAEAIDPRIQTTCIACPPDAHPDQWYCAWRFTLPT
jgi:hypothetical protein